MGTLFSNDKLVSEVRDAGFNTYGFSSYGKNLFVLKNHSGANIEISINPIPGELPGLEVEPPMLMSIDEGGAGNQVFVNENPTKAYNAENNVVSFTLAGDELETITDQCYFKVKYGSEGYVDTGYLNVETPLGLVETGKFLYAGYANYITTNYGIVSMSGDGLIFCNINETESQTVAIGAYDGQEVTGILKEFSLFNDKLAFNNIGYNYADKTITLGPKVSPVGTGIETVRTDLAEYIYSDESTGNDTVNVGVAFTDKQTRLLFEEVITIDLKTFDRYSFGATLRTKITEKYSDLGDVVDRVFNNFNFGCDYGSRDDTLNGEYLRYFTVYCSGNSLHDVVGYDGEYIDRLPTLADMQIIIHPEHTFDAVNDHSVMNGMKMVWGWYADLLPEVHADYPVYSIYDTTPPAVEAV